MYDAVLINNLASSDMLYFKRQSFQELQINQQRIKHLQSLEQRFPTSPLLPETIRDANTYLGENYRNAITPLK